MAINSANQVTRMGMAGAMWQPHGSYAGKAAQEAAVTKGGAGTAGLSKKPKKREVVSKEVFELKPIGELDERGELVLYSTLKEQEAPLQTEVDFIAKSFVETSADIDAINQNLNFLRVIRKKEEGRKARLVIVNTLDMFLEEEALLLLLLANNQ